MNTDELTAAVTDLEHYLFDIWKYEELREIGTLFQYLYLDREPGDARQRQLAREGSAELQRLLANSYQCALLQIDEVVPGLGDGPVVDALLEKLRDTVALLAVPDGAYFQWLERTWQPPEPDDYLSQEENNPQGLVLHAPPDDPREHFGYVSHDFAFYVNKVVDHIDRYRHDRTPEPTTSGDRLTASPRTLPQWTGTASELAFLLTELVEAGHLIPPPIGKKTGKEGNRAAIAEVINAAIEIRNGKDAPISPAFFKSLMRPDSPDRGSFPDLFRIRARTSPK